MNPTRLGPYTITSRLGRGGMGTVFEAVDSTTGATVAVKILSSHLAEDPGLRRRFDAEIETLKNLRHPGIVRLLAFGEQDEQPYFAMELVRGRSLEHLLRDGRRFTWRETVAMAGEIARALKVAHDHGVVHRDLKPANLLVLEPADGAADAAGPTVKLADFGIAKLFGGEAHTALGNVVGTVEYMAPEQAAGRHVDQRTDLYALGLVMYAMLTGGPPFKGKQLTEVISMQQRVVPPRVSTCVRGVPPELDELIARLLAKDPAHRPANALALGRLLAAIDTLHPPGLDLTVTGGPAGGKPATTSSAPAPVSPGGPPAFAAAAPPTARPGPPPAAADLRSPGPTAHERSVRPTRPVAAGADRAAPPPDGDLLAPTRDDAATSGPLAGGDAAGGDAATTEQPAQPPAAARTAGDDAGATAATRDFTSPPPPPADGTGRSADAVPAAARVTARSTSGRPAAVEADRGSRDRFMTVEESERIEAEQARRARARQAWWQWGAAVALVSALPVGGWLLLRPPTADSLHARIMAVARDYERARATAQRRDDGAVDLRDVRDDVKLFLARHADDPRADAVRAVQRELDVNALEKRVRVLWDDDRTLSPVKQEYLEAVSQKGAAARLEALEAFLDAHGEPGPDADADERLLPELARRTVERLTAGALREQEHDPARAQALLDEATALDARALASAAAADRERLTARARRLRRSVVTIFGDDPHARDQVAAAKRALAAIAPAAADTDTAADTAGRIRPDGGPAATPPADAATPTPPASPSGTTPDAAD